MFEVVVTARPSWARVKMLVSRYAEHFGADSIQLTLTGPALSSRYGDLRKVVPQNIQVNQYSTLQESDSSDAVALTANLVSQSLIHGWSTKRPEKVLVIADRTETLGVSVAAALMQIPLVHLQGGEISGSIDDKVRDANSVLSDFHLTTNQESANRLRSMGELDDRIAIVGCPSIDLVANVLANPLNFSKEFHLLGVGSTFSIDDKFSIIMFHPDTTNFTDNEFYFKMLLSLVTNSDMNWVWFWPNPDYGNSVISKQLRILRESGALHNVKFVVNVEPEFFITLAIHAQLIVGNSSFGIREASFIGLPTINLGNRQRGRARGANVVDLDTSSTDSEARDLVVQLAGKRFSKSTLYGTGNSAELSVKALKNWIPSTKRRKV